MDIGTWLLMVAFAYGIGVLWYDLLPGKLSARPWRTAAYPFVAMVIAEAWVPIGPTFGGMHVGPAIVAALIGVIVDWIITTYRQPALVAALEPGQRADLRTDAAVGG